MDRNHQIKLFNKQAKAYSKRLKKNTRDHKLRERLFEFVHGNVLEVSVGAGANFRYYHNASGITACDFSPAMIEKARAEALKQGLEVELITGNAEELVFEERAYDTVVSTLSLCAYPNPEKVLQRLAHWCKDEGQVLLFEHGISKNKMCARLQQMADSWLEKRTGCHIDRDIIGLIEESPLETVRIESYMLGSLHLVWAKPGEEICGRTE
ncbi:class I SAM-dependent methyltransferase [Metabacillus sp. 113a]|uniref:class I SAM-dependent methyltransferase n=1 Tax=Metabacillus sp. 113a TaxID=3404706 RepID=UPI003CF9A709